MIHYVYMQTKNGAIQLNMVVTWTGKVAKSRRRDLHVDPT